MDKFKSKSMETWAHRPKQRATFGRLDATFLAVAAFVITGVQKRFVQAAEQSEGCNATMIEGYTCLRKHNTLQAHLYEIEVVTIPKGARRKGAQLFSLLPLLFAFFQSAILVHSSHRYGCSRIRFSSVYEAQSAGKSGTHHQKLPRRQSQGTSS